MYLLSFHYFQAILMFERRKGISHQLLTIKGQPQEFNQINLQKEYFSLISTNLYHEFSNQLSSNYPFKKKFSIKTHNLEFYEINKSVSKEFREITSIIIGNDGLIWLGTNAGILIYQKEQNRFYTLPDYFIDKKNQTNYS